jgi:hypothetical protein
MRIKVLFQKLQVTLLIGSTLALSACETVQVKNRTACFVNGEISLGSTCSNTVGTETTTQLDTESTLDVLEARAATTSTPAHAPGVFQSAADYGEETTELETACRLLGNDCSYELQSTIQTHHTILKKLKALVPKE